MIKGSLQEKNGVYQVVYYKNGRYKWKSTGIKVKRGNKRIAMERMREILAEAEEAPDVFDCVYLCDYIKLWLREEKSEFDVITYTGYKQYAERHIIPYFEPFKLQLQNVKLKDIEGYYKHKAVSGRLDGKEGGLAYESIKRHSIVLHHIFEYAIRNNLLKVNPCDHAKIPKNAKRSEKKAQFYTVEQCQKLLRETEGTILHDMVQITFLYGLRRSELMGLRWCDIDLENDTLTIQFTVVAQSEVVEKKGTKNKTSERTYPLLKEVKEILEKRKREKEEYIKYFGNRYNDSGYVFAHEDGARYHPSYPSSALSKTLKQINMPHIRFHDLRHSCASMLILRGWSMKDISEWLGHADIGTTMNIYGHINMEHKRELGKDLEGVF